MYILKMILVPFGEGVLEIFAVLIGAGTTLIGIAALLKPREMSKKFGIQADTLSLPYVRSTGVRDIYMGFSILVLYQLQHFKAIGVCSLALGLVAISDFIVVQKYGDKKTSLVHLAGALIVFVYGAFLLN